MDIEEQYIYEKAGIVFLEGLSCRENISGEICHRYVLKLFEHDSWRRAFYLKAIDILSKYKKTYNDCFFVLEKIDKMMTDYPEYAEGMVDTYLLCTKAGSKIDRAVGKAYFKKAVASTRQADTYSYRKIELFHSVIFNCENKDKCDNELMAYKLAGICENYLRTLDDTKNFPYEKAISACTILGERGIWSTLCRLDDRNEYNWLAVENNLPFVLCTLLAKRKIDVWQVVALAIILLPERADEYYKLMQRELDGLNEIELSEKRIILKFIIDDILYNIPMNDKEQFLNCFEEYLVKNPKDPELDVSEIWNMDEFLKSIKVERNIVEYKDRNLTYMNSHDEKLLDLLNKIQDDDCVSKVENVLDQIIQSKGEFSIYQLNYIADFIEKKLI